MQSLDETTPPIDKENTMTDANHVPVLDALAEVLKQRRHANPEDSYVASLHHKGLNKILEKVGEEATETLLAAKDAEHGSEHKKGTTVLAYFEDSQAVGLLAKISAAPRYVYGS